MDEAKGSVDSTSSDPVDSFLKPLPDPFDDRLSQASKEKPNDDLSSKSLRVRVRGDVDALASPGSSKGNEDQFVSPETSSGHKRGGNEDTLVSPGSFLEHRTDDSNHIGASDDISPNSKVDSVKELEKSDSKIGHIDTAAPFESVKEAVSKFGGIVDWKAHRVQTNERRKYIEQEFEKAQEEIPAFKQKADAAEQAKEQALKELDCTKRLIEELKLNLERAQTEEHQAKQDSELAKLRVEEMEQGIADESSIAAKTQLEVAKARHAAAASELVTVKSDLEALSKDYGVLVTERDAAMKKAREAVSAAKEVERAVENLTIELITTKESIESTHATHLEFEEHRMAEATSLDQNTLSWKRELRLAEDELEKVNHQIKIAKDLKSKLDTASVLLQNLKDELAVYMQAKRAQDLEADGSENSNKSTRREIQAALSVAKSNLEEVNQNIKKAIEEISGLKRTATSLNAELESEKAALMSIKQQEGKAAEAVTSVVSELDRTRSELACVRTKEKEAREKLVELPKQLQKAGKEADRVKSLAEEARAELKKAKEAAEQAKAGASTMAGRLVAAQKEIEAARASEKLALGAISALHESESAGSLQKDESKGGVTLSLEEYYGLSKRAHEAEEEANSRVAEAMSQVDVAKESEMQSLNKLNQLNSELAARKEALNVAMQKAEMAKEGKFNVEQELRKWRGEDEEKQRGFVTSMSPRGGSLDAQSFSPPSLNYRHGVKGVVPESNSTMNDSSPDMKGSKKKRRSLFPRFFMFMGKKKTPWHKNA